MTVKELIKDQMESVKSWTEGLVVNLPDDTWNLSPGQMETNINWQVGHILVCRYFHSLLSIYGPIQELEDSIPLADYMKFYPVGTSPLDNNSVKPGKEKLLKDLSTIDHFTIQKLDEFDEKRLMDETEVQNPVAKTKYEAYLWCIKHQMWHNGQISMLKRIITQKPAL